MAYALVTRAQLRGYLQSRLGAAGTTFWRDAELNMLIQLVLREWNALSGYWKGKVDLCSGAGTTANQVWYTVPGTMTSTCRVDYNEQPLQASSIHDLDYGQPNWESETTSSGGNVPTTPQMWAPAGLNLIAIWPADATGGNSLFIDGIAKTPVFIDDASYVDIGSEELNAILDELQHIATFKEGGEEFQASTALHQAFLKGAANRNQILMGSAPFRRWMGLERTPEKRALTERIGSR